MTGDEALRRYHFLLVKNSPDKTEIDDPCLNEGATRTVSGSEFDSWICVKTRGNKKYHSSDKTYKLKGAYNERRCNAMVAEVLDINRCEATFQYCFTLEPYAPPSGMPFVAMSSYYYVTRALPPRESNSLKLYIQDANQYCLKTWQRIVESKLYIEKYAVNYCYLLFYIKHTLNTVYKFDESHWQRLRFVRKLKQQSVGWSLGLMINETTAMEPLPATRPLIELPTFLVLAAVACAIVFAGHFIKTRCNQ